MSAYPTVVLTEEGLREGMQIESASILVEDRLRLIDALTAAGLRRIVVGSFVSPKWTPQMAEIETLVSRLVPRAGVTYLALALNERGRERMRAFTPPLTLERGLPETHGHLCDVFIKRNTNRTIEQNVASWPGIVEAAKAAGALEAGIGLSAAWGSNWRGDFTPEQRMRNLEAQAKLWEQAGIVLRQLTLTDPMGWNMPHRVAADLAAMTARWPTIGRIRLHLHDQRGMALTSIYAALGALGPRHTLEFDTTIGGIGGCPYCGNGRAAGMAPTEDVVQLLEELGIATGVDLWKLVDAAAIAMEIVGRPLSGRVSQNGPLPRDEHRYPISLPVIETHEQAQHFRLGAKVYAGQPRPWEGEAP